MTFIEWFFVVVVVGYSNKIEREEKEIAEIISNAFDAIRRHTIRGGGAASQPLSLKRK